MQEAFTSTKQWVPEMEGGAYGEGYGFVQSGGRVESIMPDSRITILFDLNGVLLAEPTPTQQRSATARRAKKRRRGLSHIVRLRQHFRLGVYTSATLPTTNRVLQAMKSDLLHLHQGWKEWLTQRGGLFELVLFREHCRPAAEHVCRRLGKPWHTCKPLALHGLDLRRTLLVDDSPSKALDESELGNMLVLPTFQCEGAPPSDLFLFHLAELLLRTLAGYQGDVRLALAKQLQPHVPRLAAAAAPPAGPLTAALPLSGEWHWWRPNDAASADPRSVECFPRQPQASPRHPQPRSPVAAAAIPARQPAAAPAAAEPEWPRAVQAECVGAGTEAGPDGSELNSAAAGSRGKQGKHLERGFYLLKEGDEALDRHIAVLFGAALREVGRERGMPVRLLPTAMQHLLRRREWARHREHLWPAGVQLDELQPCLDYSTQQWFAPTALNGQAWLVLKRGVDPRAAWRKQLPQDLCPGSEAMRAAREQSIACCLQVMAGFAAPCDAADLLMAVLPQGCAARQSVASCRRWDPSGGGGGGGSAGGPKACGKGAAQYEGMTARFRHVVTLLQQPAPPGRQALVATDDVLRSGQGRDLVRVRLGPPAAAVQLALLALSDGFPSADADPAVLAQCRSCSFGAAAAELCSGRRGIGPWVQLGAPTARPDGDSPMAPGASPGGGGAEGEEAEAGMPKKRQRSAGGDDDAPAAAERRAPGAEERAAAGAKAKKQRRVGGGTEAEGVRSAGAGGDGAEAQPEPCNAEAGSKRAASSAVIEGGSSRGRKRARADAAAHESAEEAVCPPMHAADGGLADAGRGGAREAATRFPLQQPSPAVEEARRSRSQLHEELAELAAAALPSAEHMSRLAAALAALQAAVAAEWPAATLSLFGSQAVALGLPGADLDVVLLGVGADSGADGQTQAGKQQLLAHLSRLCRVLDRRRDLIVPGSLKPVGRARIPILKCRLQLQLHASGCPLDICIGMPNGPAAARHVAAQLQLLPALRPLVLVVKALLQDCGLNEVFKGGLSSYAIVLMVHAFLTSCKGCSVQPLAAEPPGGVQASAAAAEGFCSDASAGGQPERLQAQLGRIERLVAAARAAHADGFGGQDLGQLLVAFLTFFRGPGWKPRWGPAFDFKRQCISLQRGGVVRRPAELARPGKGRICIEDPQVSGRDISAGTTAMPRVVKAFQEAAATLRAATAAPQRGADSGTGRAAAAAATPARRARKRRAGGAGNTQAAEHELSSGAPQSWAAVQADGASVSVAQPCRADEAASLHGATASEAGPSLSADDGNSSARLLSKVVDVRRFLHSCDRSRRVPAATPRRARQRQHPRAAKRRLRSRDGVPGNDAADLSHSPSTDDDASRRRRRPGATTPPAGVVATRSAAAGTRRHNELDGWRTNEHVVFVADSSDSD